MRLPRLYLKSVRDLRRTPKRAALVVTIIAVSVTFTAGMLYMVASLHATTDDVYERGDLPDYVVRGDFDGDDLDRLSSLAVVSAAEVRTELRASVETRDGRLPVYVYTVDESPAVDRPIRLAGRGNPEPGTTVVGQTLRTYHGYDPGDEVRVSYGGESRELRVVGEGVAPTHLVVSPLRTLVLPLPEESGVLYVDEASVDRPPNLLVVQTRGGISESAEDRLEAAFPRATVTPVDEQFSYEFLDTDISFADDFSLPFFLMLLFVSAVMIYTTTTKMVRSQRREIGVLAALGYSRSEIASAYAVSVLSLSVTGSVLGAAGAVAFGAGYAGIYARTMGFPYAVYADPVPFVAVGVAVGSLYPMVAAAPSLWTVLSMSPREALYGTFVEEFSGRPVFERALSSVGRLSVMTRYALRNLTRRRLRTALTVLGILLAVAAAGAWLFPMDSFAPVLQDVVSQNRWDVAVETSRPLAGTGPVEEIPGVRDAELYSRHTVRFPERTGGTGDAYLLRGVERDTEMIAPTFLAGGMPGARGELALSASVARVEDVGHHDRVRVLVDGEARTFRVVGVYKSVTKDAITVRSGPSDAAYLQTADVDRTTDAVAESPLVVSTIDYHQVRAGYAGLLENYDVFVYAGALVAGVVAVLFIFSNMTLEIFDRRREFSVIRTLGYSRRDVLRAIGTEVVALALLASVPGVLLGVLGGQLLFRYALDLMDISGYGMAIEASKVVLTVAIVVGSVLLVVYPAYRWLTRMDLTELNRRDA